MNELESKKKERKKDEIHTYTPWASKATIMKNKEREIMKLENNPKQSNRRKRYYDHTQKLETNIVFQFR
jgi:hypothetical protein